MGAGKTLRWQMSLPIVVLEQFDIDLRLQTVIYSRSLDVNTSRADDIDQQVAVIQWAPGF